MARLALRPSLHPTRRKLTCRRRSTPCCHLCQPPVPQIVSKGRLATVDEAARAAGAAVPSRGLAPDLMTVMAAQSYFMVTPVREMLSTFKFGPFVALTETDDTSVLDAALILGRYVVRVSPT